MSRVKQPCVIPGCPGKGASLGKHGKKRDGAFYSIYCRNHLRGKGKEERRQWQLERKYKQAPILEYHDVSAKPQKIEGVSPEVIKKSLSQPQGNRVIGASPPQEQKR